MRRPRLLALVALLSLLIFACDKLPKPPESAARPVSDDDLRAVVLREADLPEGFALLEEKLTGNEEYAASFKNASMVRTLLDGWGREAGYEASYASATAKARVPALIASSADRYRDADSARQAWREAPSLLEQAHTTFSGVTEVAGPRLGDDAAMMRMYVTDPSGAEMVSYWVVFRRGAITADVTTLAPKHRDDKGEHATRLARLVDERLAARSKK